MSNIKTEKVLMRASEVIKILGLGKVGGYRYLKHLENNNILKPVKLPGIKTPRYRMDEINELTEIREESNIPEFKVGDVRCK